MRVRLPRPRLAPHRDPNAVRRARIQLVRRLAGLHATVTGGALLMPVLAALDRLLPTEPLPPVDAWLRPDLPLTMDGALARGALIGGGYEHREAETLAGALRAGGIFVDVGANIGLLSIAVAVHRPDATVWALEPVPATADRLAAHLACAGLGTVRQIRAAAGAAVGESLIVTTPDSAYAHRATGPIRAGDTLARCPTEPLDDIWRRAGRPRVDAIKIDVEGAELDVLIGARDLLTQQRPLLIVEAPTKAGADAVATELRRYDYRRRFPRGLLPYNACFTVAPLSCPPPSCPPLS